MEGYYPQGVTEEQLAALPLDDPLLWKSYGLVSLIGVRMIETNRDNRTLKPALADLRRRGNEAIPLLLKIMESNHNNALEHLVPFTMHDIGTLDMKPFLDYLRTAMRARPDEINAAAARVATKLFYLHGNAEDIALMKALGVKRPFIGEAIDDELRTWERAAPDRKAVMAMGQKAAEVPDGKPTTKTETSAPEVTAESRRPWVLWGAFSALALGLSALVIRRLR